MEILVAIIIFFGINFIVVRYVIQPIIAKLTFPKTYVKCYLEKNDCNLVKVEFFRFRKTPFYSKKKFNFFTNRIFFYKIKGVNNKLRKEFIFWAISQKAFNFSSKQDIEIYSDEDLNLIQRSQK